MQDADTLFDPDLTDLSKDEWLGEVATVAEEHGFFHQLGDKHFAAFVGRGNTLLVTFETIQGMRGLTDEAEPLGWALVRQNGWSHLCIAADGDTWFRDGQVYGQFDGMIDDGFFDDFETVLFYGAGPCGYAAAAFSVAAPGARVVAVQPQATLDPRVAEWDTRFVERRRTDFTSRYGYAPDMLDACEAAFVLYDPVEHLDGMHAALFAHAGAIPFRLRNMGGALQNDLMRMEILVPLLEHAAAGTLDAAQFATLYRARRENLAYLRRILIKLDVKNRTELSYYVAHNVTTRLNARRFRRRLADLEAARAAPKGDDEINDAETNEG